MHWLHLFDFSPLCVFFKCVLKMSAREEAKSHWLHLLTFLHCAFSNESSNYLPEKRQSHIGCICLTFPPLRFQMSDQFACLRACIVTLITFVLFFTTLHLKIFSQSTCIKLHWLHLFDISSLRVFKWPAQMVAFT